MNKPVIYLTEKEVSKRLSISPKTLQTMRRNGVGPIWFKFDEGEKSPVRYPDWGVDEFANDRMVYTIDGKRKIKPRNDGHLQAVDDLKNLVALIEDQADHLLERDVMQEIIDILDENKRQVLLRWLPDFANLIAEGTKNDA